MIERISLSYFSATQSLAPTDTRHALVERILLAARNRDLTVLAFAIGRTEVRLVVEGDARCIRNLIRGIKVGTLRAIRHSGGHVVWGETAREPVHADQLDTAAAWCHRLPVEDGASDPLASPWTSHRDTLGYRRTTHFDVDTLAGRIDATRVHRLAGGGDLPGAPTPPPRRAKLGLLLRIAAAVQGMLPADRRSFRLFVHLAKACGWRTFEMAKALMLTPRRVRQLASTPEPLLSVALLHLVDPRLAAVP